ncbi:hypothetical protein DSM106972_097830 [Dulcicalothrix desertica PCC 7102]|uniref:Uncharacterized protein n=1 Tax=Dulcicalothrix desertica PCC 7102 TaxID=232991 RepID=A0A433UGE2_9CYAN|nr:hypothetical protein [Dulcicalothrix desertica]RUS92888.1 hypothetical protein DSM106972_097830 [Dulcicalothrix desertica PCC 7102]TWH61435.1 hypothetical protein CAL7102_01001 [Dulcicalothrix desertica PCC 7102]
MQSIKNLLKIEYKESKIKTLLLRGFISWTLLIIIVTLGIQNSCNPIYKSHNWSQFTKCKETVVAENTSSSNNFVRYTDKPVNLTPTYNNSKKGSDNVTKPVPPAPKYKNQDRGSDGISQKELVAVATTAAVTVPMAILEAPALTVAGVSLAIWFVVRKSLEAIS